MHHTVRYAYTYAHPSLWIRVHVHGGSAVDFDVLGQMTTLHTFLLLSGRMYARY